MSLPCSEMNSPLRSPTQEVGLIWLPEYDVNVGGTPLDGSCGG